ncbi:MAG TPA: SGNH/GDSL hydrolase family protein [Candidatus Acidoferrales bacterium]|nr:SGNH/GDSL hydrolase family protein [Candidatus Acidoferrales bacterium]
MRAELKLAIASTLVTAAICGVVGEVWIRLTKPHLTPDSERKVALEYAPSLFSRNQLPQRAQTTLGLDGKPMYTINPLGYRGAVTAVPKPAGRTRIVVVGGSAAFDIGASDGEDWPHLVEQQLRAKDGNVEVINAAVPGYATWDVLGRLYAELWMLQPDYVVVYEAWNDIKYFPSLKPEHALARAYLPPASQDTDHGRMIENPFIYYRGRIDRLLCHSQLYTRLRRRFWWWRLGEMGLEGLVTGPSDPSGDGSNYPSSYPEWGPKQYELNLRLVVAAIRAMGAKAILATQARLVTAKNDAEQRRKIRYDYVQLSHDGLLHAFNDCDAATRRVAAEEHTGFLDLSDMLSGRQNLFDDHVHTTRDGSHAIANAVAAYLQQQMAPTPETHGPEAGS